MSRSPIQVGKGIRPRAAGEGTNALSATLSQSNPQSVQPCKCIQSKIKSKIVNVYPMPMIISRGNTGAGEGAHVFVVAVVVVVVVVVFCVIHRSWSSG